MNRFDVDVCYDRGSGAGIRRGIVAIGIAICEAGGCSGWNLG